MRFFRLAACSGLVLGGLAAQSFEVASIRQVQAGGGRGDAHGPSAKIQVEPGGVTMRNASFRNCVHWAYNVPDFQITGPDWIDQQRYDIAAKAAAAAPEAQLRTMMQGLLAERFKLTVHRQTKEGQAWVLSVAKNGPKVIEAAGDGQSEFQADQKQMRITARRMPVSELIDFLTPVFRAPIIDETGLKGRYDASIRVDKYMPEHPTGIADMINVIITALQQELGLKLDSKKMPLEYVVIDRAERTPVEN